MSWKKLIKAAKRLQMPVILADQDGNDPFVVLPLEEYELLVNGGFEDQVDENFDSLDFISTASDMKESEPDDSVAGAFEFISEEEIFEQNLAKQSEKTKTEEVEDYIEPVAGSTNKEISLEDHFYFEPLEDSDKK